jgi:2-oxoisovalerate dehydrogenase E1 component beta subunit
MLITMAAALNLGLRHALEDDSKVLVMGQDVGRLGGVFRVTNDLQKDFGSNRVIDTPLAESGIIGTAFGMALRGYRPVCEIQFDGFVYPAFDQIVSQVAKIHYRTRGMVKAGLTIRIPYGGGIGAVEHHSESPEAYFAHTAGLRVLSPSTPSDAYTMIRQVIELDDPVVFLEPKRLYWDKALVDLRADPDLQLNSARVVTPGFDVTIVAYGASVATAVTAATLAAQEGRSVEVIDIRSISPIDFATIETSVRKTGRLIIVHEAPVSFGVGAEIAAHVAHHCFHQLLAPVHRVGGHDIPYPPARLEAHQLPDPDRILDAVDQIFIKN